MSVTDLEGRRGKTKEKDPEVEEDAPSTAEANGNGALHPDEEAVLGKAVGQSIEDAAAAGAADEDDGTDQLVLPGTGSTLSTTVGGRKPNESLFKMRGVSLPIAGAVQLQKDTELWVAIPVAIDDVRVHNRRKDRDISGVVRTHTAFPIGQPIVMEGPPPGFEG